MLDDLTIAQTPSADWEGLEREARHAAVLVAMVVGVPAAVAAGAALLIFAFQWLVLLAPLVAAALTWIVWRYGGPQPRRERRGS